MKKILVIVLYVVLAIGLVGCGGEEKSVVGKWKLQDMFTDFLDEAEVTDRAREIVEGMQYEFTEDGKTMSQFGGTGAVVEGVYTVDGDNIRMVEENGNVKELQLKGDALYKDGYKFMVRVE